MATRKDDLTYADPPGEELRKGLRLLAFATLALFVLLAALGFFGWRDSVHRDHDIQSGRLESCQRTYQSFLDVFRPFFPPGKPTLKNGWEQRQIDNWHSLENTVVRKKAACPAQIQP